jgi:hypothetical protein
MVLFLVVLLVGFLLGFLMGFCLVFGVFVPFSGIGSGRFRFSLNCLLFFPFKHQFGAFCADYCACGGMGFYFFRC